MQLDSHAVSPCAWRRFGNAFIVGVIGRAWLTAFSVHAPSASCMLHAVTILRDLH
jgi:hypothetical protein